MKMTRKQLEFELARYRRDLAYCQDQLQRQALHNDRVVAESAQRHALAERTAEVAAFYRTRMEWWRQVAWSEMTAHDKLP